MVVHSTYIRKSIVAATMIIIDSSAEPIDVRTARIPTACHTTSVLLWNLMDV